MEGVSTAIALRVARTVNIPATKVLCSGPHPLSRSPQGRHSLGFSTLTSSHCSVGIRGRSWLAWPGCRPRLFFDFPFLTNLFASAGRSGVCSGKAQNTVRITVGRNTVTGVAGRNAVTGAAGRKAVMGAAGRNVVTGATGRNTVTGVTERNVRCCTAGWIACREKRLGPADRNVEEKLCAKAVLAPTRRAPKARVVMAPTKTRFRMDMAILLVSWDTLGRGASTTGAAGPRPPCCHHCRFVTLRR